VQFDRWRSSHDDGAGGWTDSGLGFAGSSTSNPHSYSEYVPFSSYPGVEFWKAELTGPGQPLHWWNTQFGVTPTQDTIYLAGATIWATIGTGGPTMTLRVVYDEVLEQSDVAWSGDATMQYTILGDFIDPGPGGTPGDFDGDGDVDVDDINLLCANIGDAAYDLDGDADADEDDLVYLIENLVELTDGSGRTGTKRGDIDLNGLINATDLALIAAGFGVLPPPIRTYGDGNLNCDALVDATDLAIMAANFGYTAPPAPVPEPITMSLMAIGGVALLRRRSR